MSLYPAHTFGVLGSSPLGNGDAYLSKYDTAGNVQWTRQFGTTSGDEAEAVVSDGTGNAYAAGYVNANPNGIGNSDAFLRKYDSAGNLQWAQTFGSSQDEIAQGVSLDGHGGVVVTGDTRGNFAATNAGGLDLFVASYNTSGDLQWTRQLGSAGTDYANAIAGDGVNSLYVAGYTTANLAGTNLGGTDSYLAKFDLAGNLQWIHQYGTTLDDKNFGVTTDSSGNVFVAGSTSGVLGATNLGSDDIVVSKFDSNGNLIWTRQFGTPMGDVARSISADALGNVYVSGAESGLLPFVAKLDAAGTLDWITQFGSGAAFASSFDGHQSIYAAGFVSGPSVPGLFDGFVTKVREVPEPSTFLLLAIVGAAVSTSRRRVAYR